MRLSGSKLVVGSYVPFLNGVVGMQLCAFQVGVGGRQLCTFLLVFGW
jgi:hypothetical protein